MDSLFIIFPLVLIAVVSLWIGNTFSIRLPEYNKLFDRKPFNCRPCFTFHSIYLLSVLYGVLFNRELIILLGFIIAFVLFLLVRYMDNKKITK